MIKEFQAKVGLNDDGLMGPDTAKALKKFLCIDTDEKAAHFLGQCHHESMGFIATVENMNYSHDRLLQIFPRYFTNNIVQEPTKRLASLYAGKPEAIANYVYGNRMGNGDDDSGDGWRFRGRGPIQLTGRNNYQRYSESTCNPCILKYPNLIVTDHYFDSGLFFFNENNLWNLCNEVTNDAIVKLTKKINGGTNGLQDRITQTNRYYKWLKS